MKQIIFLILCLPLTAAAQLGTKSKKQVADMIAVQVNDLNKTIGVLRDSIVLLRKDLERNEQVHKTNLNTTNKHIAGLVKSVETLQWIKFNDRDFITAPISDTIVQVSLKIPLRL